MPAYKIASGDLRNTPLLAHVASFGKPMLLSTGGATVEDIDRAVDGGEPRNDQICDPAVHRCVPLRDRRPQPAGDHDAPRALSRVVIGLSDHQNGISMALVAYMLGARVIEKHFTLNHAWKGTDHAFSLMPEGLRKLVRDLRASPSRSATASSGRCRSRRGRSRRWARSSSRHATSSSATCSTAEDIAIKSPADGGLPPYELERSSACGCEVQ